jgi:hypothetical protein
MLRGKGIPATFWKFTDIAWRNFVAPGKPDEKGAFTFPCEWRVTAEQLVEEHRIHKAAALKWMAAYSVCGFVDVTLGKRHKIDQPGSPSVFHYDKSTAKADWQAFISGLSIQCEQDKKSHLGGADTAYRASLALKIRRMRLQLGLPVDHFDGYITRLKELGIIKEQDGGGIMRKVTDSSNMVNKAEKEMLYEGGYPIRSRDEDYGT